MESHNQDQDRHRFLHYIVQSLHLRIDDFLQALAHPNRCYEQWVYRCAIQLYNKGRTQEETLRILLRARTMFLVQKGIWQVDYLNNAQDRETIVQEAMQNSNDQPPPEKHQQNKESNDNSEEERIKRFLIFLKRTIYRKE